MLHLKTTDNAGHCPQVPQRKLWGGGYSSPIPPSWAQCAGKSLDGLGSPVSLSLPPWDGGDGGRDKKRNNSSGIHTQLSTKLKGKEKQLLQAATQPGTQRSWRDPSVGHELCNPIAKTALRKFPRKSKWTQEQAQTRNSSTAADPISPKHKSSPLPPGSPPNSTTTPWSCTQSTPDPAVPCPGHSGDQDVTRALPATQS